MSSKEFMKIDYRQILSMPEILSETKLKRLTEHKYSAEGTSVLDPFMQHFWRWLVEQIPLHWAPNALTLVGLIINITTCLIVMWYSPDGRQAAPRWVYLSFALGLFIYQSLDAIDGKQARRTKTATPLGELFDHGCDSVSTAFVVIASMCVLQMGQRPGWMFFECFSGMVLFYIAHWQAYVSGTLRFGMIDVTEAQLLIVLANLITAVFGPGFWSNTVPIIGLEFKMLPAYFSIFGAILTCKMNFSVIFLQGGKGKNGSTIADTSVLFPIIPIAVVVMLAFTIYQKSPSHLFENHPCLYTLAFGMICAKVTNRLVVAHMTKSEMALWDPCFIGPGMLFLNQYFNTVLPEIIVLWMCLFYCTIDLMRYCASVCIEICDYLNIYCFDITSTPSPSTPKNSTRDGQRTQRVTRSMTKQPTTTR
ncbi:unnamed protein product [Owenia fusiformis]|uniref:diacylglycerol cholinephosphotransferase n=1 Tax=Owenia fusiformis TaxID=6347 RepID=A0A8J1TZJ3_OWEFU|nr:unnamed protein product [Owenia fusiformis]